MRGLTLILGFSIAALGCDGGGEQAAKPAGSAASDKARAAKGAEPAAKQAEPAAKEAEPADAARALSDAAEPGAAAAPTPDPVALAWASGATFTPGKLTFFPKASGDGELPDKPLARLDDRGGQTVFAHADPFGWKADSSGFAYCYTGCAEHCGTCYEVGFDGSVESSHTEGCNAADESPVEKKIRRNHSVPKQEWRYGEEVRIVWRVDELELKIGADVVGVGKAAWAAPIDYLGRIERELEATIFPELLLLSPDQSKLAVLAHAWTEDCSDDFEVAYIDVGPLVASAYNKAGFVHHKQSEGDEAAAYFAKASEADPDNWKYPFNMACALSKGGTDKSKAEGALARAIELGGDAVKTKAQSDGDLEAVRGEPWFAALL